MRIISTNEAKVIAMDFEKSIKERVDSLLKEDCSNYTNLGIDSTEQDRELVKSTSKDIYKIINLIDEESGNIFLKTLDI